MSNESDKRTEVIGPGVDDRAPAVHAPRAEARRTPPDGRTEVQLRARLAELETQLVEVALCLADAEARAADRLALRAELDRVSSALEVVRESRSWRLTEPIRSMTARLRGLFRG